VSAENKEPCISAGLSLVTPKKSVFIGQEPANDEPLVGTVRVTDSKGFSLNCPISEVDSDKSAIDTNTDTVTSEYQHLFEFEHRQLSLPFNVRRIDQRLSLAPNGRWSKMDYLLDKDGLVNDFFKDFKSLTKINIRNKGKYFAAFDMVLANLYQADYESTQLLLSRQNGQYPKDNPAGIDNRTIASVTDYLAVRGLIDLHIGRRSKDDKNSSWCLPLPALVAILDRYDAKIRLHEKTQLAVVRDGDKNPIKMYTNKKKRLALARYGKPVAQHYRTWLSHTATLDRRYLLPWLKRLFNWNMDLGGRFYGHYQQIPSEDRKRILIDGERTIELDYKAIHIALLYALEGLPVTTDPYVIDGHADKRNTFKAICLTLVNVENVGSLKAVITTSGNPKIKQAAKEYKEKRQRYDYLRALKLKATKPHKSEPVKNFIENIPDGAKGEELLALLLEKHEPIAHRFNTKNIGLKLQKLDSELMANVLTKLDGIPCLPVHDSIRCRLSDMEKVRRCMIDTFRELHGQDIVVTDDLPKSR
jgi:hypothetical protein